MEKVNTLDYINQMFPTEASLSGVESVMQKVQNEIRVVDAEILTAVRQQQFCPFQRHSYFVVSGSLFLLKLTCKCLCALHRLTMLESAIEQLQVMASKRQYKEASAQLEAVSQLCSHFDGYRDTPKITELSNKFKNIKQILKSHVFSDFS
nr:hypothetical protein [Tanacetum cinerariifolium]